jgi:hypothetical protein
MRPLKFLAIGRRNERKEGNVILISVMLLSLLVALATAQFVVLQKNVRASSYSLSKTDLRNCAESGLSLAVHDLTYTLSGNGGNIGTVYWQTSNDLGRDGLGGTGDEGEGDGIPTPGEPNTTFVRVGSWEMNAGLLVHVFSTAFTDVYRVVATAYTRDVMSTLDTYVRKTISTLPKVAAVFVEPDVALDLKGNSFLVDGNDHNPDGTPGPEPAVPGIATLIGSPAGANQSIILSQIPAKNYNQVKGLGASPSLGETGGVDLMGLFDAFKGVKDQTLAPATYTSPPLGDYATNDFKVTHVEGDLHLSGASQGAGVLLVDGSLRVSGQFTFYGLVLVMGDITLVGGGAGVHTYGTTLVGQSLTAIDVDPELTITGNADLFYSSVVLAKIQQLLSARYSLVYYDEK